jgi:tetratricopeptide (TPR) repeat protein
MRLGYYRESVSLLEKSLDLSRKRTAMYSNRITLNNLGYAYISIKAYDKAHKVFYEAYNEKSNPASALGLAISAYNLHDFEEAKDVLKSFLETPNFRSNATKTLKDYNIELDEDTTRFLQF